MRSNWRLLVGLLLCLVALGSFGAPAMARNTHVVALTFGSPGTREGRLSEPGGVAVDPVTHDVYVADTGNARVDEFSASGVFIRAWGWGVADGLSQPETCALNCQAGISGSGAGQFTRPSAIAVDSSAGPSAGDVYVGDPGDGRVSKFDAEGNLIGTWGERGQLSGSPAPSVPFGEIAGLAVDSNGDLLVINTSKIVFKFAQDGIFATDFEVARETVKGGLGVDGAGHIFKVNGALSVQEFTGTGENLGQVNQREVTTAIAVDPVSGDLYASIGGEIERFVFAGAGEVQEADGATCHFEGSGCQPTEAFGAGELTGARALGVDSADGEVYAVDTEADQIVAFVPVVQPDLTLDSPVVVSGAPNVANTSITLKGSVNPDNVALSTCQFEYGTEPGSYTTALPCTPAPGSGDAPVGVSAQLSGLPPGTYYFHLLAGNAYGDVASEQREFVVPGPPTVTEESFSSAGAEGAVVSALMNADGDATSFVVEYGPTSSYGASTPATSAGFADESLRVTAQLTGLEPGTLYHFRFHATNEFATALGADSSFSTLAEAQPGLPDGRGYEMVTPASNEGIELYAPFGAGVETMEEVGTSRPVRAAADGSAITYVGEPAAEGNGSQGYSLGNEFMATRTSSGWVQRDIQPPGISSAVFASFSANLSVGVLSSKEPMTAGVPDRYEVLYSRSSADGSLHPFFTTTPPNRQPNTGIEGFGAINNQGFPLEQGLRHFYAGESADSTRQFFEANDTLTANAVDGGEDEDNLYESVEGKLRLVNILPNGATEPNASFGTPPQDEAEAENATHAISTDGSRVFWTDLNTGDLYVRENQSTTALIAEQAQFLTAAADGSRVIYRKGTDLYEDDLSTGVTTDLAPGAEALGIAGTSEDASYVYFVAEGDLATGAAAGRPNLYLHHSTTTTFIATLGSEYQESFGQWFGGGVSDDWRPSLGRRTAQANGDGHELVFVTKQQLTGYDNRLPSGEAVWEVYLYDAGENAVSCLSCNPSGQPPSISGIGGYLPVTGEVGTYQLRLISEDGGRVFFETSEPLVAQDVNGRRDVYEWERDGEGSCELSSGCVYLLSGGSSQGGSYLLDASANGNDVFFVTRAKLVEKDQNELFDVYDARVGAEEPPAPSQCTGTGCQGVPAPPPIFATPSSVTFNGVGDFPAPAKAKPKPKPKPKPKAKHKRKQTKSKRTKSKRSGKKQRKGKSTKSRKAAVKRKAVAEARRAGSR